MSTAALPVPQAGSVALRKEEIDDILSKHRAFLDSASNGQRAKLIAANLTGADLADCMLAKADLSGAALTGACLKFGNFSGASLFCCEMRNIDARYANFSDADMRGVMLSGSNLSHAVLDGADFRAGRLIKNQGGTQALIDRNGAATGVDFSYCSITGASFEGADLKGANFTGAMITGTKFTGARMSGVTMNGAILTDVDLTELQLPPEILNNCTLPPTHEAMAARQKILIQLASHQMWVDSGGLRGTCAALDGMDLRPLAAQIGKYKLTAMVARKVIATGIDFSCTELQGANFEDADLRGANFEGADLRGVRFKGANLLHAKFLGADMRPLPLKTGGVLPCDLSQTAFTSQQRNDAVFS